MTSSRSRASTSNRLAVLAGVWTLVLAAVCLPSVAHAEKRKRVVVLELDGPKAEKFHDDLVRLIKKSHTVVPVDKWNGTAEELDASKLTDKDIKKVAKKLHVDAIVMGKIEKRRDEYLIKLKLRAGKTGALVGEGIDTKAEGPRLDGKASKDLKDELMDAIDSLGSNRGGGGGDDAEDEEDKPVKKGSSKKSEDSEDEEDRPVKKGFSKKSEDSEDEEDKPVKKGFSKKSPKDEMKAEDAVDEEDKPVKKKGFSKKSEKSEDSEDSDETAASKAIKGGDDEEESPLPKAQKTTKKRPAKKDDEDEDDGGKKTASRGGDDEEGVEAEGGGGEAMESSLALSPGNRAVDVVLGLSLNARRMSFKATGAAPVGYKGVPVAGVLVDATVFPLAIGHKSEGMLKNLGLTVMYDKVIKINSKSMGMSLPTTEARYAVGATFRYPFGKAATAPVLAGTLRFGRQNFTISGMTELPNVNYTIVDPAVKFMYPVSGKVTLDATLGAMLVLGTGQIQKADQYGAASVFGIEGEFGGDYALTKSIFARAAFKFETIGFTFKGTGAKAMANAVSGARDTYLGGAVTVGYLY